MAIEAKIRLWLERSDRTGYTRARAESSNGGAEPNVYFKLQDGNLGGGSVRVPTKHETTEVIIRKRGRYQKDFRFIGVKWLNTQTDISLKRIKKK